MKVLLDENLDPRFGALLNAHEAESVKSRNWRALQNGELFRKANEEFEGFVTLDRSIVHQQNLSGLQLRIVVTRVENNRLETLEPLAEAVRARLDSLAPGLFQEVDSL